MSPARPQSTDELAGGTPPWEGRQADEVFGAMFKLLYSIETPVLPLDEIIHWRAIARHLGAPSEAWRQKRALVSGGCFYRVADAPPDRAQQEFAAGEARNLGADLVLFPVVAYTGDRRSQEGSLFELPWFFEAIYVRRTSVDADLRTQLGSSSSQDIRRLARRANERYSFEVVSGHHVTQEHIAAFGALHSANLRKYGHARDHYGARLLAVLLGSLLADAVHFVFRRELTSDTVVQTLLCLVDTVSRRLVVLVQGIDHERVPPGQNLYLATFYETFCWGERCGILRFDLGRGAERSKLRLGANVFRRLDLIVLPLEADGRAAAAPIAASARERFACDAAALQRAIESIAAPGLVETPFVMPGGAS